MSANNAQAWNALLCPPLGFGLNFLLLWLILHRTPKEMMVHSRVLLQTCLMDCLILFLQTIGQQIIIMSNYERHLLSVAFLDGYLVRLFRPVFQTPHSLFILNILWLIFTQVSIYGISVQFIYRYLVLVRNKTVTLCQNLMMLAVPILCTGIIVAGFCYYTLQTLMLSRLPAGNVGNVLNYSSIIDFDQQPLFTTTIFNEFSVISFALLSLMIACSYTIIFFCGWKMVRFVSQHATFNDRLKELNKQLTRTLILLATFPLLLQLMALLIFVNTIYQITSVHFSYYTFFIFHWFPLLNAVASILTNRPYREVVTRKLRLCPSSRTTVSPVAANDAL